MFLREYDWPGIFLKMSPREYLTRQQEALNASSLKMFSGLDLSKMHYVKDQLGVLSSLLEGTDGLVYGLHKMSSRMFIPLTIEDLRNKTPIAADIVQIDPALKSNIAEIVHDVRNCIHRHKPLVDYPDIPEAISLLKSIEYIAHEIWEILRDINYEKTMISYMRGEVIEKSIKECYGWLSPSGKFYEVEWGKHAEAATKLIKDQFGIDSLNPSDWLVDHGWILIHDPSKAKLTITSNKDYTEKQKEFLYSYFVSIGDNTTANRLYN